MADYKESNVSGTSWQRAVRVVVENPYGGIPSINFVEEKAINLDGNITTQLCSNLTTQFDAENPLHVDIYTKLNELYTLLREARDAEVSND